MRACLQKDLMGADIPGDWDPFPSAGIAEPAAASHQLPLLLLVTSSLGGTQSLQQLAQQPLHGQALWLQCWGLQHKADSQNCVQGVIVIHTCVTCILEVVESMHAAIVDQLDAKLRNSACRTVCRRIFKSDST